MAVVDYEVIDPPFSPTPSNEIREAFQYVSLSSNDTLLELGCGDARNLVMAAKEFDARAIGYELSDEVYKKAMKKIEKNGVEDYITLRKESFYEPREEDLERATVAYIYLSKTANRILESALRNYSLKVLSRVFPLHIQGEEINRIMLYDYSNFTVSPTSGITMVHVKPKARGYCTSEHS